MSNPLTQLCLSAALLLSACAAPQGEDSPSKLRVAVCQTEVSASVDDNLAAIEVAIERAAAQRAELVCFPEACVHGWVNPAAHREAHAIPGPISERVGAAAKRHGVMVALGVAEKLGDRLFNSVVLIDERGRVLLRHRKVNVLRKLMTPPYETGDAAQPSTVDTRFGRIGLLICADTFRKDLVDSLANEKPDLVIVPYGWAAPAASWPEHGKSLAAWVKNTARTCSAPVVGVDGTGVIHGGPWKGYVLGGQSVVCAADGSVVDILPDRTPEMRVFEIEIGRESN